MTLDQWLLLTIATVGIGGLIIAFLEFRRRSDWRRHDRLQDALLQWADRLDLPNHMDSVTGKDWVPVFESDPRFEICHRSVDGRTRDLYGKWASTVVEYLNHREEAGACIEKMVSIRCGLSTSSEYLHQPGSGSSVSASFAQLAFANPIYRSESSEPEEFFDLNYSYADHLSDDEDRMVVELRCDGRLTGGIRTIAWLEGGINEGSTLKTRAQSVELLHREIESGQRCSDYAERAAKSYLDATTRRDELELSLTALGHR